jgi:hypothetical protein
MLYQPFQKGRYSMKDMVQLIHQLAHRHSTYKVYSDFVEMSAKENTKPTFNPPPHNQPNERGAGNGTQLSIF